jgi:hypothetical protein
VSQADAEDTGWRASRELVSPVKAQGDPQSLSGGISVWANPVQRAAERRAETLREVRSGRWRMLMGVLRSLVPGSPQAKLHRLWGPAYRTWYELEDYREPE